MNRRELLQRVAAASGVAVTEASLHDASPVPALAVIEVEGHITPEMTARIREVWKQTIQDTPYAKVKVIVLDQGLRLTLLDQQGRELNGRVEINTRLETESHDGNC